MEDNTEEYLKLRESGDWVEEIVSAWKGHRKFAEWLVDSINPKTIVELGVDYGYSTFVFGNTLQRNKEKKNIIGVITGIDLFMGDEHAGLRNTQDFVLGKIKEYNLSQIVIQHADFTQFSKLWSKPIDILHIDGLHTYEAVKQDFTNWSPFVRKNGIILFHDVAIPEFGIRDFFKELTDGYRLYFVQSAGLGIYTKNKILYDKILNAFDNVLDFDQTPLLFPNESL